MIGTILSNRYKLIAELGSGGMAWVYLAEDLVERKKVAVKVLYPQHSQDIGFLQRFIREAKLSMTLCQASPQPNIVCVLDYGADRDTHYLVLEHVQGTDLGQILEQQGPIPWQRALAIARQVALALEHANQLDIVHRDIKPSNIMVQPDGIVRVLDFGIARARSSPNLTVSGFVGSPHYAAPEQAMGRPVDIRADLYSLGVVLYRMLSGDLPFQGDTPWAVAKQHIVAAPPPLQESWPDLPQPVILIVQRAMAKRPEDRFQTPGEMVQAIDAALSGSELPFEATPAAAAKATARLDLLYRRAQLAVQAEKWQEAVDLYSQILRVDPNYDDVSERLDEVGQQIRLDTLYRSALRAMHSGQWDRALAQLDKIAQIEPNYRDIHDLRLHAEREETPPADAVSPQFEFPTQIPTASVDEAGPLDHLRTSTGGRQAQAYPLSQIPARRRALFWGALALLAMLLALGIYAFVLGNREPGAAPLAGSQPSATLTVQVTSAPLPSTPTASPTPELLVAGPSATPGVEAIGTAGTPSKSPTPNPVQPGDTPSPTPPPALTLTATPTSTATQTATAISRPRRRPLSGQIAFPRFDPARGTYDVYICRVDGSGCKRLAPEVSQPDFLPNGSQLVVHSWKSDEKGLLLLSLSGQLTWRITDQIEAARPSVSFQGDMYVYHSRQESDRQPRLYRTYGTDNRPILREGGAVVGQSPSWLPDRRILYSGCWLNDCGILAMRADGTFPRQIVAGGAETNPEASPDGKQVAFMSQRDGNWEVYAANLDGSNLRRLTHHRANDGLPTWSPDGQYIAFVTDRDGPWALWVMRPDGGEQRRLFDLGGPLDGQVRGAAAHEIHGWVEERISWGR